MAARALAAPLLLARASAIAALFASGRFASALVAALLLARALVAPALPALVLATLVLAASPARAAPPDLSGITFSPQPGTQLPLALRFADQAGHPLALGSLAGGPPLLLALGYFDCPSLCGVVRDDLFDALDKAGLHPGTDYQLAFASIDPSETPAQAARAFADDLARHPTPDAPLGWHFLTGSPAAVSGLEQALGFTARFDPSLKQFIHPAGVVVATGAGVISRSLMGVGYKPGDLRAAVVQARSGGIERAAQPVLLLCFHYDAVTGRYSLDILKVLRVAAALTILGIAGLVLVLVTRRYPRRS